MLESLLTPRERPEWQHNFFRLLAVLAIAMFLITSSVAFLREAKAVRMARQKLSGGYSEDATIILKRYLKRNNSHEEALVLGALAATQSEELKQAGQWRESVAELYPNRLEELDPKIQAAIRHSILNRKCRSSRLLSYYDEAQALGNTFHPVLLSSIQDSARRCLASDQHHEALALVAALEERGKGATLIEEIFIGPLRQAVNEGHYNEATNLGKSASRFSKEAAVAASEVLEVVRQKVETSRQSVAAACRAIRTAPTSRVGRFWCFPRSMPPSLAKTRDGWGRPLHYRALDPKLAHSSFS